MWWKWRSPASAPCATRSWPGRPDLRDAQRTYLCERLLPQRRGLIVVSEVWRGAASAAGAGRCAAIRGRGTNPTRPGGDDVMPIARMLAALSLAIATLPMLALEAA